MRPVLPICDSLAEVAAQQTLEGLAMAGLVLSLYCFSAIYRIYLYLFHHILCFSKSFPTLFPPRIQLWER